MKFIVIVLSPLGLLVAGCASQDQPVSAPPDRRLVIPLDEESSSKITPLTVTRKPAEESPKAVDLQPSPELARAVELGQARPGGPVTDERYRHWYATAELRVQLEGEIGKRTHLLDLLQLAVQSEDKFVERFGIDVHPGESADRQLRMFQLIRDRLQEELNTTDREIHNLETKIGKIDLPNNHPALAGGHTMSKPISEFGLLPEQTAKLSQLGIKDARDFALQFYLPEQHQSLATLLGVELEEAQRLVRDAAEEVPEEELDELVREARRPHEFGVLPPDLEREED